MSEDVSASATNLPIIVVDGDATVDWATSLPEGHFPKSEDRLTVKSSMLWHWGGAILLTCLVRRGCVINKRSIADIRGLEPLPGCPTVNNRNVHHSFSLIDRLPLSGSEDERRWRIKTFVGFQKHDNLGDYPGPALTNEEVPRMVIVNDPGLGFGRVGGTWSRVPGIRADDDRGGMRENPPWLILNLRLRGDRREEGDLWNAVYQQLTPSTEVANNSITMADRLIVVTTVENLRDAGAEVSRGLSWERSAQDVLNELERNEEIRDLKKCRRLIVSLGPSGALLIDRSATPPYTLYFDTEHTEGTWEREHSAGKMFGYSQTLTAAVACKLIERQTTPRDFAPVLAAERFHEVLGEGVQLGLSAIQQVYNRGFSREGVVPRASNSRAIVSMGGMSPARWQVSDT